MLVVNISIIFSFFAYFSLYMHIFFLCIGCILNSILFIEYNCTMIPLELWQFGDGPFMHIIKQNLVRLLYSDEWGDSI